MNAAEFLHAAINSPDYRGQVTEARRLPARPARYGQVQPPLPEALADALRGDGIEQLYVHQAHAIEAVRAGQHVVVVTGTASGKTLCYNVPVLETFLADQRAKALYLFPTKALA
ncbi:MAG: DEAD/DEAH box helicase, partial [Armatimonadetes bacterium]|nr:DEAD/DEAH box helicase [Armatimonadota bacterium]